MPRALLYYLAQTWTADRYRQAQRDAPARAASHSHRPRPSPRGHRARGGSSPWPPPSPNCDKLSSTPPRRQLPGRQPRTCIRPSRRRAHRYRGSATGNHSEVRGRGALPNTLVKTSQQI
jgi:hypothetical protein